MSALDLEVVTPSRRLVATKASEVYLPGVRGEFGVLPEHAPLISILSAGVVRYQEAGGLKRLAVRSGFVQVLENKIVLLADEALRSEEVKAPELQTKREELEVRMISADVTPEERAVAALELAWVNAQLSIAG